MFTFYFVHHLRNYTIPSPDKMNPHPPPISSQLIPNKTKTKKLKSPSSHKRKKDKKQSNDPNASISVTQYRGVRSLFAIRKARRKALEGQQIPLLNIVYTTAFLQFVIVICITTLIHFRTDTEFFFYNTTETFNGIFKLDSDADSQLLRTENLINSLQTKFNIFFNLTKKYSDHFIYPEDILIENKSVDSHHRHNLIPSAVVTFNFKQLYITRSYLTLVI